MHRRINDNFFNFKGDQSFQSGKSTEKFTARRFSADVPEIS